MTDTDEKKHVVTIDVNGARRIATVEARKLLVHLLRDDLGLTGTHVGCDTSQCGACTPGMIMAVRQLLKQNPNPAESDIRHQLAGNICRCTGYTNIVRAVQ